MFNVHTAGLRIEQLAKERDAALGRVASARLLMQHAAILLHDGATLIGVDFEDSFVAGAMRRHADKLNAATESKEGGA